MYNVRAGPLELKHRSWALHRDESCKLRAEDVQKGSFSKGITREFSGLYRSLVSRS